MKIQDLVEQAIQKIPNKNKLIMVISKRAHQLSDGAQPLVKYNPRKEDYMEIAIREIIEDKIWYRDEKQPPQA